VDRAFITRLVAAADRMDIRRTVPLARRIGALEDSFGEAVARLAQADDDMADSLGGRCLELERRVVALEARLASVEGRKA
jgi:hypothetical protein